MFLDWWTNLDEAALDAYVAAELEGHVVLSSLHLQSNRLFLDRHTVDSEISINARSFFESNSNLHVLAVIADLKSQEG